jgi:hypothetical protein
MVWWQGHVMVNLGIALGVWQSEGADSRCRVRGKLAVECTA